VGEGREVVADRLIVVFSSDAAADAANACVGAKPVKQLGPRTQLQRPLVHVQRDDEFRQERHRELPPHIRVVTVWDEPASIEAGS
jgi:hypothetical protein